ncbi:MAG: hypothetical protein CMJ64_29515 [Planctomycetaceae bacterium]|nr:hypothetical protein [Planctomycetaceae bacterium]
MSYLLLTCFAPLHPALAGPPLITDDSETPGRGGWEINFSHSIEKTRDEFLMETPLIDINYGFLENDQWKIEFPVLSVDPTDDEVHWGMGDIEVGWKYRFWEEDERGLMASIYPQPLIPVGNERLGLSDGYFELLLPVEVGKHFCDDKLFVYAEVGYNIVFDHNGANEWIYGVAFDWAHSERLELLFEVGGVAFEDHAEADFAFFNVGLKYELNDRWSFIGSSGRSLRDRRTSTPELLTFVGFQFTLDGREEG